VGKAAKERVVNTGQIILLADNVRDELERARKTEDLNAIRQHLDKAIEGVSTLIDLAKAANSN
jgi:hypothetical protein